MPLLCAITHACWNLAAKVLVTSMNRNSSPNISALAAVALLFVACQPVSTIPVGPVTPNAQTFRASDYAVQPGDVVGIRVFENPELSSTYRVPPEGVIDLPLIGEVTMAGQTPQAIETDVTERLGDGFIVEPRVSIEVVEYRPVFILGGVRVPGIVSYTPGVTVLGAVAASGGHSQFAVLSLPPNIIRASDASKTKVQASMADPVNPGDIIEIPELFR